MDKKVNKFDRIKRDYIADTDNSFIKWAVESGVSDEFQKKLSYVYVEKLVDFFIVVVFYKENGMYCDKLFKVNPFEVDENESQLGTDIQKRVRQLMLEKYDDKYETDLSNYLCMLSKKKDDIDKSKTLE